MSAVANMDRSWYVVAYGQGWIDRVDGLDADEARDVHAWFVGLGYRAKFDRASNALAHVIPALKYPLRKDPKPRAVWPAGCKRDEVYACV